MILAGDTLLCIRTVSSLQAQEEKTMPTDTPIACQLGVFSADEQRRYQTVRSEIDAAVTCIVETDNGYEFHVPGDDTMLARVGEWIALERRCCPFFEFTVAIGRPDSLIRVALTGSPEVKRFLATELRSPMVMPSALLRHKRS